MNLLPFPPRPITRLPATGFGALSQVFKIQATPRQPDQPSPTIGPFFAALPTPGKGFVNGLNTFLFPKPEPGKPVLPPVIPPETTLNAALIARMLLGPTKFFKVVKGAIVFAVGGSIPEALVGLGVTEAIQPAKEIADTAKALFLPHHPVELGTAVFTPEARRFVNRAFNAIDQAEEVTFLSVFGDFFKPTTPHFEPNPGTFGFLGLGGGQAPPGRTNLDATGLGPLLVLAVQGAQGRYYKELAGSRVGSGRGDLSVFPGEKGDPP